MSALLRVANLVLSAILAWFAYTQEMTLTQLTSIMQAVTQLSPLYGSLLTIVLILANFVIIFLLLGLVFDRLGRED